MNKILDGMTRKTALGYVFDNGSYAVFAYSGRAYVDPVAEIEYGSSLLRSNTELKSIINAYYDSLDAAKKPQWVEPEMGSYSFLRGQMRPCKDDNFNVLAGHSTYNLTEEYATKYSLPAEIARTNARRKIEAFIAANGGGGKWLVRLGSNGEQWDSAHMVCCYPGAITCGTEELANEVIRRYPSELRLLVGLEAEE